MQKSTKTNFNSDLISTQSSPFLIDNRQRVQTYDSMSTCEASFEAFLGKVFLLTVQFPSNLLKTKTEKLKMKILQKSFKCLLLMVALCNFADGFSYQRVFRESQICGYHNGHRKYLEFGDSGKLSANNITAPSVRSIRLNLLIST